LNSDPASPTPRSPSKEEKAMPQNRIHSFVLAVLVIGACITQGCSRNNSKRAQDKAEKAVEQVLDAWARGESADKYADANQSVQASDPDWKAGYRLLSFLTIDSKQEAEPSHFQCRVSLSLQDPKGAKVVKEVGYDVKMGSKTVIDRMAQ
jgi:hypothetical protein